MATSIGGRLKHAWNAFNKQETEILRSAGDYGASYSVRPHISRPMIINSKSMLSTIYNRIGVDVAEVKMQHVRVGPDDQYLETLPSRLNYCLTVEANVDQAARAFRQDMAMTLFDKGVIAIVPVETTLDPDNTSAYDIKNLRVGEIVAWFPKHVKVSLYNEATGRREELMLEKSYVAIVENPLYNIMNEPNSTLQRLTRKLSLLDTSDELSSSGKLDLIIQLPYVIKSEARKQQAEQRRKDIEVQLKGSEYGIAYTDGTERITQLNRPAENNLLAQVTALEAKLYSELGLSPAVFDGTADEKAMINYYNRTVKPILDALVEGMSRAFLTKTARSQGHTIKYFRDPFSLVTISDLAEIGDKLSRNEIMSSNEIRSAMGLKPAADPKADELRNKNMPTEDEPQPAPEV